MRPPSRAAGWRALATVAFLVIALDQVSKAIVRGAIEPGERVDGPPIVDFVHVMNQGVAFGFLGEESRGLVVAITCVALAAVLGWFALAPERPWAWLAIGLLAGGALGNLIDRAREDAVTDWIDLPAWPSFNLADMAITLGAVVLVLSALGAEDERPEEARARGE